jgi:DNA polymerase
LKGGRKVKTLICDFETRSSIPIGDCGSYKYMASPDFRPLLLAYAFDDEPIKLVDFTTGESWPSDFFLALEDPAVTKLAWNCAFEREVIHQTLEYTAPEGWLDVMHIAAVCGLPMSLDAAGKALGLPEDKAKMKEGKALIRWFCVPTKDGYWRDPKDYPDKWKTFRDYCIQDVAAERNIYNMLGWTPDATERRFWSLDQRINDAGINTDPELVRNAITFDARYKAELTEQAVALSGLENPGSVSQIKAWLQEQEGITVPSLNKKVVADVVAQLNNENCRKFMAIRTELAKSSTKKYEAIARSAGYDNHVRGCFQFYGASRTGRFAGRLVQLQNLPQNHMPDLADAREIVRRGDYDSFRAIYDEPSRVLSELIRTALIPEPGHKFIVSDFSAIEARVISWLADEEWRLEAFRAGKDIYCESASQMFGVPVVKHGVNGELRAKGKVCELALGYGGNVGSMLNFGADKLGMTEKEIADTVALWREKSPKIVNMWWTLERAAARCIVTGKTQRPGIKNVAFQIEKGILWMTLPSGRRIAYFGAKYEEGTGKYTKTKKVISYMGRDQKTGKWTRTESYGPKLVENLVQATARDCLRDSMLALTEAGFDVRAHVHDEVIITEPIGGRSVSDVSEIMSRELPWAPGLPLRADGYECPFYQKD